MKPSQIGGPNYDARIRRAQFLASAYPFASEVLMLFQQIAAFQKSVYGKIPRHWGQQDSRKADGQFRSELDLEALLPHFPEVLSLLEHNAPAPVAKMAHGLASREPAEWIALLSDFWSFGGRPVAAEELPEKPEAQLTDLVARAFLQPYGEFLAANMPAMEPDTAYRVCPRCGSAPLLGVLRPEGDGGKRFLVCSFCIHEWEFRRIYCAACGEESEDKLPVYVAEQFPHIRVETCEACKFYVRTIDLTRDGNAVPIADDLAAIPLSLWAHEHGYTRLQANLLGT